MGAPFRLPTGMEVLFVLLSLSSVTLKAFIYAAGLVVTLRRRRFSHAARLGALGFGLLLLEVVTSSTAFVVEAIPGLFDPPRYNALRWAEQSASTLLIPAGGAFLLLALHRSLTAR